MHERIPAADLDYLAHYMEEFYGSLTEENEEIGRFLRERQHAGEQLKVLDVACGPSALYWAMFHPSAVVEFHGLDARQDSLDFVRSQIDATLGGTIDARYLEVARWHGAPDAHAHVHDVAQRFATLTAHNIVNDWPYADGAFEVVVSCFGMDHVATDDAFDKVLTEAARVLKPGGSLVLVTLCETDTWRCGDMFGACLYTTQQRLADALARTGFLTSVLEERRAATAIACDQGYEKMLFCHGVKV